MVPTSSGGPKGAHTPFIQVAYLRVLVLASVPVANLESQPAPGWYVGMGPVNTAVSVHDITEHSCPKEGGIIQFGPRYVLFCIGSMQCMHWEWTTEIAPSRKNPARHNRTIVFLRIIIFLPSVLFFQRLICSGEKSK